MHIITAPNPVLRRKAEEVSPDEMKKMKSVAKQMARLMYKNEGCGLAAPQVGLSKRLVVLDVGQAQEGENGEEPPKNPVFYVNPQVKKLWGEKAVGDEGCLSIPGITIPIERYNNIIVDALDSEGQPFTTEAEGFHARALQHELDHLEGMTMFEHLDPIERITYLRDYEAAVAAGAKPGDTGSGQSI
jgi:peptide deformylase